jgi:hypothetical protein
MGKYANQLYRLYHLSLFFIIVSQVALNGIIASTVPFGDTL